MRVWHGYLAVVDDSRRPRAGRPIVLACFPDELHDLGLLSLAYRCGVRGCEPCYLGAALPFEDLETACDDVGPDAVLLSVTRRSVYRTHQPGLVELARRRAARTRIFVGGQGAPGRDETLSASGVRLWSGDATLDELLVGLLA